jgi:transposase-like protein
MNPQEEFCPNMDCPDRGKMGNGNIVCHSQQEKRCKCKTCGRTFSVTKGTALYRIKQDAELFVMVVTLLAFGCPVQAIVMAMGLDERTVRSWWLKSGEQSERVHDSVIGKSQLDLQHVQADEIKVKIRGGTIWMAMAMLVSTRLWLGGVVSDKRDKHLIRALAGKIRKVALCRDLLLAVDGLSSYVDALRKAFRSPLPTGKRGRHRLIPWQSIHIVQVVKQRHTGVLNIQRRLVQGTEVALQRLLAVSMGGTVINTAYIERLNATFRQRLACLTRRTRHLAQQQTTLHHSMMVLGTVYNFCTPHHSLRLPIWITSRQRRWVHRTPAMATGLTDHIWTVEELMTFKVPPPAYVPPKRRGRPPKAHILQATA